MEIITFFSFKGGVGRTQALLNTACEFAQRGKKVLLMDFDLHAPGLSLMECMRPIEGDADSARPGTLDFFEWLLLLDEAVRRGEPAPEPINLASCAYAPLIASKLRAGAGFLKVVPAASISTDCSDATFYSDRVHTLDSPLTEVIRRTHRSRERNPVIEQIRFQFSALPEEERPDVIFIDARTGITGIADLLLTRSSDRIVLVAGLNHQNLWGLESTLRDIERSVETADWLRRITIVVSPVPLGEHDLTEKRTKAISDILGRHVDPLEREMFGDAGLTPELVEIPYDAQLALLEDPILLRHENSVPSARYRDLADRLGGKTEPLQFKPSEEGGSAISHGDNRPQEHPLTRVPPWDAGLSAEQAEKVLRELTPKTEPDKPYAGWQKHALNYLANSLSFSGSGAGAVIPILQSLGGVPLAQRNQLMSLLRGERQHGFSIPRDSWPQAAWTLGKARVQWLSVVGHASLAGQFPSKVLMSDIISASAWVPYWIGTADALMLLGNLDAAMSLLEEAEAIARSKNDSKGLADTLRSLGDLLMRTDKLEEARARYDEVLPVFRDIKERLGEANTLRSLGDLLVRTGKLKEARALYDEALPIYREVKSRMGEANTLMSLGDLLVRTDKLEEARALYDEALPIYREVKSRMGEANTLMSLGALLARTDKLEEARALYDEALPIYRDIKERIGEANTLMSLGDLLVRTDKLEEARARYDEALRVFREVKSRIGEANTLRSLGDLLVRTGKLKEARARYDEALPIYRDIKERIGEANTLRSLGDLLVRTSKLEEARARYDEALPVFRDIKERIGEANTLMSLGDLLVRTGKLEEARVRYDEALPIYREVKQRLGEANTLMSLGDLLVRTDKLEEAHARYDEALSIFREVKERLGEANTLRSVGDLLVRTGKLKEARARYDEALPIYRHIKERLGEANTLKSLGDLLLRTGKLEEARMGYDEALPIYREVKSRLGEANTLHGLAKWHLSNGDLAECEKLLTECLQHYTDLADSEGLWETRLVSAKMHATQGRKDEAKLIAGRVVHEARCQGDLLLAREAQALWDNW